MTKMPVVLRREGTFDVVALNDSHQCGKRGTRQGFKYIVYVHGESDKLDERGFVVDNDLIQQFFDTTLHEFAWFPSCERIALDACAGIGELVGKERCTKIEVTISGSPGASLTATWERP